MKFILLHIFYMALSSFIFVSVNSKQCAGPPPNDYNEISIPYEAVLYFEKEIKNWTANLDQNIRDLRTYIKTTELPDNEGVDYLLFTAKNPLDQYVLTKTNKENLKKSPYNDRDNTVFIIHGFNPELDIKHGILGVIKDQLLEGYNYNVIFVNYTAAIQSTLVPAIRDSYLVAKNVSKFIHFLMDNSKTKLDKIHLVGNSLGAQISAHVGQLIPGIARISALDPGGLLFDDFPNDLILNRGDAKFIDAIHTSGAHPFPRGLGYYKPAGDLDFYPNGGKFQPGCNSTIPIEQAPTDEHEVVARICMHNRAIDFFINSICSKCTLVGVACESYESYKAGKCPRLATRSAIMGQRAKKPKIPFPKDQMLFLDTNSNYPFCIPSPPSLLNELLNFK